jgi:hypothetical protein
MQLPSSWGQCWTKKQWLEFKKWYLDNSRPKNYSDWLVPESVIKWSESSWKKYFYYYMIQTNKYFVYPYLSLTSNFSDVGTHIKSKKYIFQRPLQYFEKNYNFIDFSDSFVVYDAFCEILPEKLKELSPKLRNFDFEVDLYGSKPLNKITRDYILSTKRCTAPIISYGREMKPIEANIIEDIQGEEIFLGKKETFKHKALMKYNLDEILYYYNVVEWLHLKYILKELNKKFFINSESSKNQIKLESAEGTIKFVQIRFFLGRLLDFIKTHRYKAPLLILKELKYRMSKH